MAKIHVYLIKNFSFLVLDNVAVELFLPIFLELLFSCIHKFSKLLSIWEDIYTSFYSSVVRDSHSSYFAFCVKPHNTHGPAHPMLWDIELHVIILW